MNFIKFSFLALGSATLLCAAALNKVVAGDPSTDVLRIDYTGMQIPTIDAELRYNTVIQVPHGERVIEVTCGDGDERQAGNWIVSMSDTGDAVYVKPTMAGIKTNLGILTDHGNRYTFFIADRSSESGAHAALLVVINAVNEQMRKAIDDKPKFVAFDEAEKWKVDAQRARADLEAERVRMQTQVTEQKTQLRAEYPAKMQFDYKFDKDKDPFNVDEIYHDDKFTYIKCHPRELPVLYEDKDGPSVIQYKVGDGMYTIPKILDNGWLKIGKKRLDFSRQRG